MNFFKKKQQNSNPEVEKLKSEIINQTNYLSKLLSKYYNDPKNEWKHRLRMPYLYLSGRIERVKDDIRSDHYQDNRHFLKEPMLKEMQDTERDIKNLKLKIRTLSLHEQNISGLKDSTTYHPLYCDCDNCYNEDKENEE